MSFRYYIKRVPSEKFALDFGDDIFQSGPCLVILALKATVRMFM